MKPADLHLLSLFITVAETASFSAAAKKLGLPKSSVSRGVAGLEEQLGTQLLHRTTRKVSLSTAGAALYERTAPLLASLKDAVGSLPENEQEPAGDLRITAPHDVSATVLADVIARFCARYPAVKVDVRATNQAVDLVAEGIDLALRAVGKTMEDSSLVRRKLASIEIGLFAAPDYVARRGMLRDLEEAAEHRWVLMRQWRTRPPFNKLAADVHVLGDDFFFLRQVIRNGGGIGVLPTFLAKDDLASGRLVRVMPKYAEVSGDFMLLYPQTQHVPRKVMAFRDFLLEYVQANPLGPR